VLRSRTIAAALMLAATATLAGTTGADAATPAPSPGPTPQVVPSPRAPGSFHQLQNVGNNLCLQPFNTSAVIFIVQKRCNGSPEQGWARLPGGDSNNNQRHRFLNAANGSCLSVDDNPHNGELVFTDECTLSTNPNSSVSNAEWTSSRVLPSLVTLRTHVHFRDGLCLDVPGATSRDGNAIQLFQCNGSVAQAWWVGFN
jgi:Ricin-type beta-trefoil lectin domain